MATWNEQAQTYTALQAELSRAVELGRERYAIPETDPQFRSRRETVLQASRTLANQWARAATDRRREEVLSTGAQSVIVAYSTMGAGDPPGWVTERARLPSLGVAPVPQVPSTPPPGGSTGGGGGGGISLSPSLSPTLAPTVDVGAIALVALLLLWIYTGRSDG